MTARTSRRNSRSKRAGRSTSSARSRTKRSPNQGFPKGSDHPSAQLTITQVKALRAGRHDDKPYAELAAKWGVSPAAISLARTGKTWSWLPGAKKPIKPTDPKRHRKAGGKKKARRKK